MAAQWDGSASATSDPDTWYVAFAPDDVKAMSLEQLDDLFRLSIVDEETNVWRPGMDQWQPLGFVAAMGGAPTPLPPLRLPPPSCSPAVGVVAEPRCAPAWVAPTSPSQPFPNAPTSGPQPLDLSSPVIASTSPRTSRGSSVGRWLLFAVFLGGVGLSLYRNGLFHAAARALGRERLALELEGRLGGPAFGTMRSIEKEKGRMAPFSHETMAVVAAPHTEPPSPTTSALRDPIQGAAEPVVAPKTASLASASARKEVAVAAAPAMANAVAVAPPHKRIPAAAAPVAPPRKEAPAVAMDSPRREAARSSSEATVEAAAAPAPRAVPAPRAAARADEATSAVTPAAPRAQSAPKAAPVVEKPESEMSPKERLDAAIRRSIVPSGKSK